MLLSCYCSCHGDTKTSLPIKLPFRYEAPYYDIHKWTFSNIIFLRLSLFALQTGISCIASCVSCISCFTPITYHWTEQNFENLRQCVVITPLLFQTNLSPQSAFTCSILTMTQWRRSGIIFIVNFEHISHLVLVFLLLTLSR